MLLLAHRSSAIVYYIELIIIIIYFILIISYYVLVNGDVVLVQVVQTSTYWVLTSHTTTFFTKAVDVFVGMGAWVVPSLLALVAAQERFWLNADIVVDAKAYEKC